MDKEWQKAFAFCGLSLHRRASVYAGVLSLANKDSDRADIHVEVGRARSKRDSQSINQCFNSIAA